MELLEINQYSQCYYSPKSKENIKGDEAKKYRKRLFYGKGLIDIDSIVSVEPIGTWDEETLEFTNDIYRIYFKNSDTRVFTDDEGYELIKEYCLNNQKTSNDIILEDKNIHSSEKNIEKDFKTEVEKYLKDLEHGIQMLRRNGHDGGIIKLFNDEDVSEENNKYIKYMVSLTWDELDNLCMNNANIDVNGIYGDEECYLLKRDGNPIVTYYNIIKNSLYKKLSESIEIKYDYKESYSTPENNIKKLLLAELSDYLDTFIDNVIKKYDKEIFDYLFGKIYLDEQNV